MKDSALIAFLPVIAAVAGAFFGAVVTVAVGIVRDGRARQRECVALMRLLAAEVIVNRGVFDQRKKRADIAAHLSTAIWDESRVKLVQLIEPEDIATLVRYYETIKYVRDHWKGREDELSRDKWSSSDQRHTARAESLGDEIVRMAGKTYVGDPKFVGMIVEMVNETGKGRNNPVQPSGSASLPNERP